MMVPLGAGSGWGGGIGDGGEEVMADWAAAFASPVTDNFYPLPQ